MKGEGVFYTVEEKVESAAAWLDVRYPGWAQKINLDTFNIGIGSRCVGGQIGVPWETLRTQWTQDVGAPLDGNSPFACGNALWREVIAERQQQPVKKVPVLLSSLASLFLIW